MDEASYYALYPLIVDVCNRIIEIFDYIANNLILFDMSYAISTCTNCNEI